MTTSISWATTSARARGGELMIEDDLELVGENERKGKYKGGGRRSRPQRQVAAAATSTRSSRGGQWTAGDEHERQ